jgi:hypothetical protein
MALASFTAEDLFGWLIDKEDFLIAGCTKRC